jgi:putative ABC transport system permease protein
MNLFRLVVREILHRKVNFILSLTAIVIAVVFCLGSIVFIRSYDKQTEILIEKHQAETKKEMAKLEDKMRRIMKGLGFNIYIFPEGQNLNEIYAQGYSSKSMPEEYTTRIAQSDIITINHLLPSLTKKIKWPEEKRIVMLVGTRGEVPLKHRSLKKPILNPVKNGEAVIGYELHNSLGLKPGDMITFMDKKLKVSKCHNERGTIDDITIWMNLKEVQEMLDMNGKINAILALECNCVTSDRLGEIRGDIAKILPGTKVIEKGSKALARAEARLQAGETAKAQLAAIKQQREALRNEREKMISMIIPAALVISILAIAFLTLLNVRERIQEIGILMAIGCKSSMIFLIFLVKSLLTGFFGACLGLAIVFIISKTATGFSFDGLSIKEIISILILTPLFAGCASWLPAFAASQKDSADILRKD